MEKLTALINQHDAPWCLVLGLFSPTGLSIVRSLGSHGVRVLGMCRKGHALGRVSRHCTAFLPYGDKAGLLHLLKELGSQLSKPLPVLVESDDLAMFMDQHRQELKDKYRFHWQEGLSLSEITPKAAMIQLARQAGIPVPGSVVGGDIQAVERAGLRFPVFVKPQYNRGPKGLLAGDMSELALASYNEMFADGYLVQEIVPGPDENIYAVGCYSDRQGRVLAATAGRKRRQMPRGFGTAAFAEGVDCQPVIELSKRLIRQIGYYGPADVEFKKSARDGEFMFIEINYRVCGFNELYSKQGLDLAYISYLDLCGKDFQKYLPAHQGPARWMSVLDDLHTVLAQFKGAEGYSLNKWLKDLKRTNCFAVLSRHDPLPFLVYVLKYVWRALRSNLGRWPKHGNK